MWHEHAILTRTGKLFNLLNPSPDLVDVTDITYALARLPRFTGHARSFWSVAQHSLLCHHLAQSLDQSLALHALLHDAAEAYIGDLSTPLKSLLPRVREIEAGILEAVYTRLGIEPPGEEESRLVKEIDHAACAGEGAFFMSDARLFLPGQVSHQHQGLIEEALLYIPSHLYNNGRRGRRGYSGYGELSKKLERVISSELAGRGAGHG